MGRDTASWLLAMSFVAAAVLATFASPADVEAGSAHVPACVFDHAMLRTSHGTCRPRARRYPANVKTGVQRSIYDGALTFGIPYLTMLRLARCESHLDPLASDGTHDGLYQFLPSTFSSGARRLRKSTGIRATSWWNPLDAAYVAGYLFAIGQSQQWSCAASATPPPA